MILLTSFDGDPKKQTRLEECVFYSVKCDGDSSRVSSFRVSRIVTVEISKLEYFAARGSKSLVLKRGSVA